jgi:hypothetical protein
LIGLARAADVAAVEGTGLLLLHGRLRGVVAAPMSRAKCHQFAHLGKQPEKYM